MKITLILVLAILIGILWKYISISSTAIKQLKKGMKEPYIDPMQAAILPEVFAVIFVSLIAYFVFKWQHIPINTLIGCHVFALASLLLFSAIKYYEIKTLLKTFNDFDD